MRAFTIMTAAALVAAAFVAPARLSARGSAILITNAYAYEHPERGEAVRSPDWLLTAGSLFLKDGWYWTGVPDHDFPDAKSAARTDSSVFRAVTKRRDLLDATVHLDLRLVAFSSTPTTPARAFDGVHLMLRYQSQYELYYISVARRDGTVVIKKKCPGGPSNGGTYYNLSPYVPHALPESALQSFDARIRTNADGSVGIALSQGGKTLVEGVDRGVGCPAILGAGGAGVRGDNAEFFFTWSAENNG